MRRDDPRLSRAIEVFAANRTVSFVWADAALVVTATYGELAAGIAPGAPLLRALPVLYGYEDDLDRLSRAAAGDLVELPNVALRSAAPELPRLNVCVAWDAETGHYVVMIARALSRAALELELQQQVRARRLAETQLLEQAEGIRAANETLARINRDLGEFAHVVSHDLKAPMRALRYFADDLEQSLDDPAAGDPHEHLARLRAQSRRMTGMLSGLLAYAKLDRKSDAAEPVDLRQLVGEVVASLPKPPGVQVVIAGTWPRAVVVPALVDLVLRNLVENAIRYARQDGGEVRVACEPGDGALTLSVRDDGPGIPEAYHAAIFQPFTRLDDASGEAEHGSVGMGLALVKRAADAAEATIVVHSRPEIQNGTEFRLVWPCRDAAVS